jgi:hypothetical protein
MLVFGVASASTLLWDGYAPDPCVLCQAPGSFLGMDRRLLA